MTTKEEDPTADFRQQIQLDESVQDIVYNFQFRLCSRSSPIRTDSRYCKRNSERCTAIRSQALTINRGH